MPEQFQTPVGRLVWGHPMRATIKKDINTNQPVIRDGKQVTQWVFGIAFPKAEFEQHVLPIMQREAATLFPHGTPPKFAWKYKDGDGIAPNGKPYSEREGYAGHYVLTVSTESFEPTVYKFENGAYRQMKEEELKPGHYLVLNLTIKANKPDSAALTPGLYINPNGILHVGYGPEILSAAQDPDELFTGTNFQLPPGASTTPIIQQAPTGTMPTYGQPQTTAGNAAQPQTTVGNVAPQQQPPMQQYQQPVHQQQAPHQYQQPPVQQYQQQQPPMQQYQQPAQQPQANQQQLPPPAHDFVQNAGGYQQQSYPANQIPGVPPQGR